VTRSIEDVEEVFALVAEGHSHAEISRRTGVSRAAIRSWLAVGSEAIRRRRSSADPRPRVPCRDCPVVASAPAEPYAYLLGLYLGDGYIGRQPPRGWRLRITCTSRYHDLIDQCADAMAAVNPVRVGILDRGGCVEVVSSSVHWPCLFPQHGPGPKHRRPIVLAPWQRAIAAEHAKPLLRGLIHSDGCRDLNPVNGKDYPRYQFSNRSADIRRIFTTTCDVLGVSWRESRWVISVARRADVAFLDTFIGPKS
jgi:hypothetical protein